MSSNLIEFCVSTNFFAAKNRKKSIVFASLKSLLAMDLRQKCYFKILGD
jgi:hypothetical protein